MWQILEIFDDRTKTKSLKATKIFKLFGGSLRFPQNHSLDYGFKILTYHGSKYKKLEHRIRRYLDKQALPMTSGE